MAAWLLAPLLAAALLGAALTWLVINTGMRREVLLAYDEVAAPADRAAVPREAAPLLSALVGIATGS